MTFDWFIKPSNFSKVIEGNYNNNPTQINQNMSRSMQDTMQRIEEARRYSEMLRQYSDE
jgi:hypothetical protein